MKCKLAICNLLIFLITVAKPTTAKPTTVSTGGKYILVILITYGSITKLININIVWCNLTNMFYTLFHQSARIRFQIARSNCTTVTIATAKMPGSNNFSTNNVRNHVDCVSITPRGILLGPIAKYI